MVQCGFLLFRQKSFHAYEILWDVIKIILLAICLVPSYGVVCKQMIFLYPELLWSYLKESHVYDLTFVQKAGNHTAP